MENVKIFAKLTTPGNEVITNTTGTYDEIEKIIRYNETDEDETEMTFYINDRILGRNNENISMSYFFDIDQETKNEINIKGIEQTLLVRIKTIEYYQEERRIFIKYQIIDAKEECTFEIKF